MFLGHQRDVFISVCDIFWGKRRASHLIKAVNELIQWPERHETFGNNRRMDCLKRFSDWDKLEVFPAGFYQHFGIDKRHVKRESPNQILSSAACSCTIWSMCAAFKGEKIILKLQSARCCWVIVSWLFLVFLHLLPLVLILKALLWMFNGSFLFIFFVCCFSLFGWKCNSGMVMLAKPSSEKLSLTAVVTDLKC